MNIGVNGDACEARLEGGELRAFLLNLDEYEQMFHKVERRLREARVVEVLSNAELRVDYKADFRERRIWTGWSESAEEGRHTGGDAADEEHSAFSCHVPRFDQRGARDRHRSFASAGIPEVSRCWRKQIAKFNEPPFTVLKNEHRDTQTNWLDLLEHVKNEGKRDASVQRYKGLGEMNAEQLADTTMNPEKRTLLRCGSRTWWRPMRSSPR